jgi:hypothetical protein
MPSLAQVRANRLNALKSTGPRTVEGKERSRANAVRHGLTAETVIASVEDREDYQAFELAVASDYDADGAVERELVLRLANVLWRLRRANAIETALLEWAQAENETPAAHDAQFAQVGGEGSPPSPVGSQQRVTTVAEQAQGSDGHSTAMAAQMRALAQVYLRLATVPTFPLDRLCRYEHTLWRQARQLVVTLESLRRRKHQPRRRGFPFSFKPRRVRE